MKTMMIVKGMFLKNSTKQVAIIRRDDTGQIRIETSTTPKISEKSADHNVISILTRNAPKTL